MNQTHRDNLDMARDIRAGLHLLNWRSVPFYRRWWWLLWH